VTPQPRPVSAGAQPCCRQCLFPTRSAFISGAQPPLPHIGTGRRKPHLQLPTGPLPLGHGWVRGIGGVQVGGGAAVAPVPLCCSDVGKHQLLRDATSVQAPLQKTTRGPAAHWQPDPAQPSTSGGDSGGNRLLSHLPRSPARLQLRHRQLSGCSCRRCAALRYQMG